MSCFHLTPSTFKYPLPEYFLHQLNKKDIANWGIIHIIDIDFKQAGNKEMKFLSKKAFQSATILNFSGKLIIIQNKRNVICMCSM